MELQIWEDADERTYNFKGSFGQGELAALAFTELGRAILNQPASPETPMADELLKVELIFRQYETERQQKLKGQSNG